MPTPIAPSGDFIQAHPAQAVYARARWADAWELVPYLRADVLHFVAAPALDAAELSYEYGTGIREDAITWANYDPLSIGGYYVKVEVDQGEGADPIQWLGVIIATQAQPFGAYARADGVFQAAGRQRFTAAGLGFLLDRQIVTTAQVFDATPAEITIGRAPGFNLGRGTPDETQRRPNASDTNGAAETRIFHNSLADASTTTDGAEFWNAKQAIDYILAHHSPDQLEFRLDATLGQTDHLSTTQPLAHCDGRTVREILNELIHRRRLASYKIVYDEAADRALVRPFTFNDADLTLPDASTIGANQNQRTLDIDNAVDVQAETRVDHASRYDQVIARGEPRGAVVNLSSADGNLEEDWTTADATAYNDAASGAGDYPADFDERRARNAAFRSTDALARVYSYLRIPSAWDGWTRDGEGGGSETNAWPSLDDDGAADPSTPIPIWTPALRLARLLPLVQGTDYSAGKIAAGTASSNASADSGAEFLPLAVYAKDKRDHWRTVELLRDDNASFGYPFTIEARPQEDAAGLILRVQGSPQHAIADGDFTPCDDSDNIAAALDWRDMIAVAYITGDAHAEARYPVDGDLPANPDLDPRVLVIPCPGCYLDYVPYQTIVGIADGALQRTEAPGFVRDDRDQLRAVAQLAHSWYGTDRAALSLSFRQIRALVNVGDLIVEIGAPGHTSPIRTVCTAVTYDLLRGQTSFETEFLNLDPALFARR